jgi:hypothetical protein
MSLTGSSLEMYIFHFEAIPLSTLISGFKPPIFTYLGSFERPLPVMVLSALLLLKWEMWPATNSKRSPKISNFGHDQEFHTDDENILESKFWALVLNWPTVIIRLNFSIRAYHSILNRYLLNLHPTRIEFDCPDVFVAARCRTPDENIKFSLIFQFISICYLNHILYTIRIIVMTI